MNSDEERSLFESFGWEYNFIRRVWVAPNGMEVTNDQLVDVTCSPDGEERLRQVVTANGKAR